MNRNYWINSFNLSFTKLTHVYMTKKDTTTSVKIKKAAKEFRRGC